MTPQAPDGGCWPTSTQELLLRACLIDGPSAVAAWHEWQSLTDIENLDDGSSRLLPLLWNNLHKQGAQGAQLTRYKSMSRWIWARNQMLIGAATRVIELLEAEGISTLVLKGGALATLYYPSVSARPMSDFDVLVPTTQAPRAFALLMRRGYFMHAWTSIGPTNDETHIAAALAVLHGAKMQEPGGQEFDVHQHVNKNVHAPNADEDFWAAAIPLRLGATQTRTLCAEDALYLTCAHGVEWNPLPPLRWIADATMILRSNHDFDWSRVVRQCRRHGQSIPVRQALNYLHDLDLGLTIPQEVLRQLQAIPTSRAERRLWATRTLAHSERSRARYFWMRIHTYLLWNSHQPWHQRPFNFLQYMSLIWGINSLAQVPARLMETIDIRNERH